MRLIANLGLAGNLGVLSVDLHDLEESSNFFRPRLLVDVYDIEESQDACPDALYFIDKLRKLDLDRHEEDWDAIVEIEFVSLEIEPFQEPLHRLMFSLGHLSNFLNRSFLRLSGLTLQLALLLDWLLLGGTWKGELYRLRLMDQEV
jgi:hypothetical protein